MDKIPCTGNDATGNQYRVTGNPNNSVVILRFAISADRGRSIIRVSLLVELDSVRMRSNLICVAPKVPRVPKYKKRHIVLIKSRTGTRI